MAKKKTLLDADEDAHVASDGFEEEFCIRPEFAIDEDGVEYQVSSGIDRAGREHPDPIPMELPIGYTNPPSLVEMMRQMIHNERFQEAQREAGEETFDEASDFDVFDDDLLLDQDTAYQIFDSVASGPKADPKAEGPPLEPAPQKTGQEGGSGGGQPTPPPR